MLLVGGLVGGVPCRAVRPCAWDARPHLKMGSQSSPTTPPAQPPAAYNPKLAPDGTYLIPMARQDPQGGFCFGSALRETSLNDRTLGDLRTAFPSLNLSFSGS